MRTDSLVALVVLSLALPSPGLAVQGAPQQAPFAPSFERNGGHYPEEVDYVGRFGATTAYLMADGFTLDLRRPELEGGPGGVVLRTSFVDGVASRVEGRAPLAARTNYLVGSSPGGWSVDNPNFGGVRQHEVWPGVDVVWKSGAASPEYDLVLAPGADPSAIRMRIEGAEELSLDAHGSLVMQTPFGPVVQTIPSVFQERDGERVELSGRFALLADGVVGFEVEAYDPTQELVIDPVVEWLSYLTNSDYTTESTGLLLAGVDVDDAGAVYVYGNTLSKALPTTPGAYKETVSNLSNQLSTFAAKFSADGSTLLWMTYLEGTQGSCFNPPGSFSTQVWDGAVGPGGRLALCGWSSAFDFPTTPNALYTRTDPCWSPQYGYLTLLSADGASLVYSTLFYEVHGAEAVEQDAAGMLYAGIVVSHTTSVAGTPGSYQPAASHGGNGIYVAKIDPGAASGPEWGTYVSASGPVGNGTPADLAVDGQGRVFMACIIYERNMPTPNGLFTTSTTGAGGASEDLWVGRLSADGSSLDYGTFCNVAVGAPNFSSSLQSMRPQLTTDGSGRIWYATVADAIYPITAGADQSVLSGGSDIGVTCLDTDLSGTSSLVWSTYFGGGSTDVGGGVVLAQGKLIVTGSTFFAQTPCQTFQGNTDHILGVFDPDTGSRHWTSLIGGPAREGYSNLFGNFNYAVFPIGSNALGDVVVGSLTGSSGLGTPGVYQETHPHATNTSTNSIGSGLYFAKLDVSTDPCGPSDSEPPVVTITTPSVDESILAAASTTLAADVVDETATTVTSSPAGVAPGTLPAGGGSVSSNSIPLIEGLNVLSVNAVDEVGLSGGDSVTVYRDSSAPVLTVTPTEGSIQGTSAAELLIAVTDETETDVTVDAVSIGALLVTGGGAYGLVDGSLTSPQTLAEGANVFTVSATDAAGNTTTVVRTLVLDSQAPMVTIDAPENGDVFGATPVTLTASVNDDTTVEVTGDLTATVVGGVGQVSASVGLTEGWNDLTVVGTDLAGNDASAMVSVLLDTTDPTVEIVSPLDLALLRGTADFHALADDATPGSGVASVQLLVDGVPVETFAAGPYEAVLDTTALSDGSHVLTAVATDGVGRQVQDQVTIFVDNTPPTIAIIDPAPGALLSGDVAFTATAEDTGSGLAELEMRSGGQAPDLVDDSVVYAAPVTSDVRTSLDSAPLTDGALTLSARAVDAAGNEAVAEIVVQTDNTAPDKAILSPAAGATVGGVVPIEVAVDDGNLDYYEVLVDGQLLATSTLTSLVVPYDTTTRPDGVMVITVQAYDTLGHTSSCTIEVTVNNGACVEIHPETLNLKSKGKDKSITVRVCGYGLEALLPTESADLKLLVPGGSPVPSTSDFSGDDHLQNVQPDGFAELLLKFDRQLLIDSIRAGIQGGAITESRVVLTLEAGDLVLGSDDMKLVGN